MVSVQLDAGGGDGWRRHGTVVAGQYQERRDGRCMRFKAVADAAGQKRRETIARETIISDGEGGPGRRRRKCRRRPKAGLG